MQIKSIDYLFDIASYISTFFIQLYFIQKCFTFAELTNKTLRHEKNRLYSGFSYAWYELFAG